jgi:DNA-binding Xre family transcriptional regulator
MVTSEDRVFRRVSALIDDMLEEEAVEVKEVDVPARTLARIRSKTCQNVTVRTLVRICDALGYDLILNARKR